MTYVKWTIRLCVIVGLGAFLHYFLPQRDIVRIVATEVVRTDVETTDAQGNPIIRNRDVRYIKGLWPNDRPSVYRNEDTGWGFPFYFKFDTANLAAEADNAVSKADDPKWMVVRHYGWRIPMLDMFPNAVSIRPATGPDEKMVPWFNIFLVSLLVLGLLFVRRVFLILRKRHVDPVIAEIDQEFDETAGWWRRQIKRLRGR